MTDIGQDNMMINDWTLWDTEVFVYGCRRQMYRTNFEFQQRERYYSTMPLVRVGLTSEIVRDISTVNFENGFTVVSYTYYGIRTFVEDHLYMLELD